MNKDTVTKDRTKFLGGSDIPVIMGLSPFKTRWQLLQEKAEIVPIEPFTNPYVEYGNVMEVRIRDYINKHYNRNFEPAVKIVGDLRGNTDGLDELGILEVKTTSHIFSTIDGYMQYIVQMIFYMKLFNVQYGMLAVYERPDDFNETFDPDRLQVFEIDIKDYLDTMEEEEDAIESFRRDLKALKENPLLCEEDFLPAEVVDYAHEIIELESKLQEYKEMENQLKQFKEKLKAAMEEFNIKSWTMLSGTKVTLIPDGEDTEYEEIDIESLKKDYPEICKAGSKYVKRKLKKGRKGHVRITIK